MEEVKESMSSTTTPTTTTSTSDPIDPTLTSSSSEPQPHASSSTLPPSSSTKTPTTTSSHIAQATPAASPLQPSSQAQVQAPHQPLGSIPPPTTPTPTPAAAPEERTSENKNTNTNTTNSNTNTNTSSGKPKGGFLAQQDKQDTHMDVDEDDLESQDGRREIDDEDGDDDGDEEDDLTSLSSSGDEDQHPHSKAKRFSRDHQSDSDSQGESMSNSESNSEASDSESEQEDQHPDQANAPSQAWPSARRQALGRQGGAMPQDTEDREDVELDMDMDVDMEHQRGDHDARSLPPRERVSEVSASLDDANATASESEGSLALEGIDSARQWPSMGASSPRKQVSSVVVSTNKPRRTHTHLSSSVSISMGRSELQAPTATRAKITITKDSAPRKWICKHVPVKTLGGEMMMPIWFSQEEMLLNEPVPAPKSDPMDIDSSGHHHHRHHHHHHHHHQTTKRKLKLKDMALRESRDPMDYMDMPEPMNNKNRHDPSTKASKGKTVIRDHPKEKKVRVQKEGELKVKVRKVIRERSESQLSRDSTPTTPVDRHDYDGSSSPPPRERRVESNMSSPAGGPRPRPFVCEIEDCGKRFVDAIQLERHVERHGPKELACDLDMCGKLFSSIMLLRRHQSMVHKRRSEKWESPPGTTRQRSGRSRRKEPRIVASGDIMDPAELELVSRASMDVDSMAEDDESRDRNPSEPRSFKEKPKKEPKPPKIKELKPPKEPKPYTPRKLVPKEDQEMGEEGTGEPGSYDENAPTPRGPKAPKAPKVKPDPGEGSTPVPSGPKPRPFHCTHDDCKKVFIDQIQLERHLERHGPKELECGIDGCRKRFSAQMLLRRHQSMVHKRRSSVTSSTPRQRSSGGPVGRPPKYAVEARLAAAAAAASTPLAPSQLMEPVTPTEAPMPVPEGA